MATTIPNNNIKDLYEGPELAHVDTSQLDTVAPKKTSHSELDLLFNNIVDENLEEIKQENKELKNKSWFSKDKLNQFSKIIFTRESLYRGLVDILGEELPSLAIESLRGFNSFVEHAFAYVVTTAMIMVVPNVSKFFAKQDSAKFLKSIDPKEYKAAMLFNREDLEDVESFEKAKARLLKEETLDKMNLIRFWRSDDKGQALMVNEAAKLKDFMKNLQNTDAVRQEITDLKNSMIQKQSITCSIMAGSVGFIRRLFRKYVLGADRFVGSQKYLSDKDAKKLGSKGFTTRQMLGTVASMVTSPGIVYGLVKRFKSMAPKQYKGLTKLLSKHLDTKHSFYPKAGNYLLSSSGPYFLSRIFNAQDKYEFLEILIKTSFAGGSLFLGDRFTNGRFAKAADKELSEKHGTETGLLYEKPQNDKGFGAWLANTIPEAKPIAAIIEKTKSNKALQKDATDAYQKTFLKGFGWHTLGIIVLKYAINNLTKLRVKRDLAKLK